MNGETFAFFRWKVTVVIKLQADPPRLMDYYDIHPRPDIWESACARVYREQWRRLIISPYLRTIVPDLERRDVPPASADVIEWDMPTPIQVGITAVRVIMMVGGECIAFWPN